VGLFSFGQVENREIDAISRWITDSGELHLISDARGALTHDGLRQWIADSITTLVVRAGNEPIAIGTLSVKEAPVPSGAVEFCHVIVRPEWRRRYHGSHMVLALTDLARGCGFQRGVGRVVPGNEGSFRLLRSLNWSLTGKRGEALPEGFLWHDKDLRI
jgi:RimJ/RimL family protein N-acetyltransferase